MGETDMKPRKVLFAAIFFTVILGPVFFSGNPDRDGLRTFLSTARLEAAPDHATKYAAKRDNSPIRGCGSRLTNDEVLQLLASHNRARARVGLGPLEWSRGLATYAQEWADHLASTSRRMEHRPSSGEWKQEHGENLFIGTAGYYGVRDAVAMWVQEQSAYDGGAIDLSSVHDYGHYTQVVWRATKRVGCAKVTCAGNVIVVCNYDPPGNFLGQRAY
jgi:pathogenesis-related protein 1